MSAPPGLPAPGGRAARTGRPAPHHDEHRDEHRRTERTAATADAATADEATSVAGPASPGPLAEGAPRRTAGLVVLLGSLAALAAVNIDLYLPSLPVVARDLGTSASAAQLTVTSVLVGMALGTLLIGPVSDRYGRRPPVVAGCALFVLASLLCLVAPTMPVLVALRFVGGIGVAAGAVTAMAVVRDLFTGAVASRLMSRLVLVIGVAPLFAPSIGGAIAGVAGWRAVFAVLALAGAAMLLAARWRLPETRPATGAPREAPAGAGCEDPAGARRGGLRRALADYAVLLRDVRFVAFAMLPGLFMAIIVCYVAVSPFVLQEVHGLSTAQFSLVFALNGIAIVGGSQLNAALVTRFGPVALLRVAVPGTVALAALLLGVVLTGAGGLVGLLVPLWLLLGCGALIPPNAVTLALAEHGRTAGSAAAVVNAAQHGVGGLVGILAGALGGDALAMAVVVLAAALACGALLAVGLRRERAAAAAPARA